PARLSLDRGGAGDDRVAEPGRHLRFSEPLRVRPEIEELEDVRRAQLHILLRERVRIRQLPDSPSRPNGKVMAALRAHAKASFEPLVAVMRSTARTGIWMRLALGRLLGALVFDGDVDPAAIRRGHAGILEPAQIPAAPSKRTTTGTFSGAGSRPVTPT